MTRLPAPPTVGTGAGRQGFRDPEKIRKRNTLTLCAVLYALGDAPEGGEMKIGLKGSTTSQ